MLMAIGKTHQRSHGVMHLYARNWSAKNTCRFKLWNKDKGLKRGHSVTRVLKMGVNDAAHTRQVF